jgi:isopenicillin N synthase-like dioxygenase
MSENVTSGATMPVIDLGSCRDDAEARHRVGRAIDATFQHSGFMVIVGHGVPSDLIASMYSTTAEFFLQPEEEKLKYLSPVGGSTRRGATFEAIKDPLKEPAAE